MDQSQYYEDQPQVQPQVTFSDLFERYLNHHLAESFQNKSLSTGIGNEIEGLLYNKVREMVNKCQFTLDDNTYRFIAKMYLSDIEVNGLRPFQIRKNEEVKEVSDSDLSMLAKLFYDNEIGDTANDELRIRVR